MKPHTRRWLSLMICMRRDIKMPVACVCGGMRNHDSVRFGSKRPVLTKSSTCVGSWFQSSGGIFRPRVASSDWPRPYTQTIGANTDKPSPASRGFIIRRNSMRPKNTSWRLESRVHTRWGFCEDWPLDAKPHRIVIPDLCVCGQHYKLETQYAVSFERGDSVVLCISYSPLFYRLFF